MAALVTMGRALNMKVVAEGVEEEEQAAKLAQLGCDYAQGFFFGRPAPAETIPALIESWNEKNGVFHVPAEAVSR